MVMLRDVEPGTELTWHYGNEHRLGLEGEAFRAWADRFEEVMAEHNTQRSSQSSGEVWSPQGQ